MPNKGYKILEPYAVNAAHTVLQKGEQIIVLSYSAHNIYPLNVEDIINS